MDYSQKSYLDKIFNNLIPEITEKYLPMIKTETIEITRDFIYPDTLVQLRPGKNKEGQKMLGGPKYIVIHDTGMVDKKYTAQGLNQYIHEQANSQNGRVASWHFSIDDKNCYQHVPTTEIAWHAGDGSRVFGEKYFNATSQVWCIGGGNQNGIGIETCIYQGGNYDLTLKRAAQLVARLLIDYKLELSSLKEHYDFSGKNCPNIIRSIQGRMEDFRHNVNIIFELLKLSNDIKIIWETSDEKIIDQNGIVFMPLEDTKLNLKCLVMIENNTYTYQYETLVKGMSFEKRLENSYCLLYTLTPKILNIKTVLPDYISKYNVNVVWLDNNNKQVVSIPELLSVNSKEIVLQAKLIANDRTLIKEFVFQT